MPKTNRPWDVTTDGWEVAEDYQDPMTGTVTVRTKIVPALLQEAKLRQPLQVLYWKKIDNVLAVDCVGIEAGTYTEMTGKKVSFSADVIHKHAETFLGKSVYMKHFGRGVGSITRVGLSTHGAQFYVIIFDEEAIDFLEKAQEEEYGFSIEVGFEADYCPKTEIFTVTAFQGAGLAIVPTPACPTCRVISTKKITGEVKLQMGDDKPNDSQEQESQDKGTEQPTGWDIAKLQEIVDESVKAKLADMEPEPDPEKPEEPEGGQDATALSAALDTIHALQEQVTALTARFESQDKQTIEVAARKVRELDDTFDPAMLSGTKEEKIAFMERYQSVLAKAAEKDAIPDVALLTDEDAAKRLERVALAFFGQTTEQLFSFEK